MSYFVKQVAKDICKAAPGPTITCDISVPKMVLAQAAKMAPPPTWSGWTKAVEGVTKSSGPFGNALDAAIDLVLHDDITQAVAQRVGAVGHLRRVPAGGALYRFEANADGSFPLDVDTLGLLSLSETKDPLQVIRGDVEQALFMRIGRLALLRRSGDVYVPPEPIVRFFVAVRWELK